MYTIKQAAARTGLSVPTVRMWERRYGVVAPVRTATGYRLYDDAAIDRLIAMRQLVDGHGLRPSQAAAQLADGTTEVEALVAEAAAGIRPADPLDRRGPARPHSAESAVREMVDAARALDIPAMEQALDAAFAAERFEGALEHVVFPVLRAIGDGWSGGGIDVSMEHAASETIRRRLARFFDAAASGGIPPSVVVGLPPGSHHDIGALGFAVAARRRGLGVLYLGSNVPVESWLHSVTMTAVPLAVVGVVSPGDVPAARSVVAALRAAARPPRIALGGTWSIDVAAPDAVVLPLGVDAAVDTVVELVRSSGDEG